MFDAGDLPAPPSRQVAVVTCMDARLDPEEFLGLGLGEAHVIRNAGGRVSEDTLRSLVISQRLLGTDEVVVIHHTDCGMMSFTNDDLRQKIRSDLGADASGTDFMPFSDLEDSVREDVERVRSSELVPDDVTVRGAVYEVETGGIREVPGR
nr:carbonic anhydrase [Rubrobacter aplysinae]